MSKQYKITPKYFELKKKGETGILLQDGAVRLTRNVYEDILHKDKEKTFKKIDFKRMLAQLFSVLPDDWDDHWRGCFDDLLFYNLIDEV